MTAQGAPYTRFRRAVARRNVLLAELAAREMGRLGLADALLLVCLYAADNSPKFEPAAVRWLVRLAREKNEVTLGQLQLAAAALAELRGRHKEEATKTLLQLTTTAPRERSARH